LVKLRFSPERLVEASGLELDVLKEALFRLKCGSWKTPLR